MKLCYLAVGDSIHTKRWLSFFKKRGHDVYLMTSVPGNIGGITEIDISLRPFPRTSAYKNLPKIKRILKEISPDILHSHYVTQYGWAGALANFHPFVLTGWGSDMFLEPYRRRLNKFLFGYTARKADLITTETERGRSAFQAAGVPKDKIELIHWGVDLELFRPGIDARSLRQELGLGDGPVVFSPRAMKALFNVETILRAFPRVLKEFPSAKLVLKGPRSQESKDSFCLEMERIAGELKIGGSIVFQEEVPYDKMPLYYSAADVVVSIPDSDSMPISVLEGIACGAVPVLSDLPSVREWFTPGVNAIFPRDKSPESLADSILTVLKNEPTRNSSREANYSLVREKADHAQWMLKMEGLYEGLVGRPSP
ncbi:MAG: glycosyltransferase family 4 protein [Candidatus Eisenbacteria bacterium]|nr:glycosyltransferase family 4 protein [Candidatus Eisenbacteria bacterium]